MQIWNQREKVPSFPEIEDAILACIPLVTNVRDFGLEWFPGENFPAPYLDDWLSTLSNNLAELWLYVLVTNAELFAQAPTFPRLRRCSITFLCSRFSEYNRPIQTTLASFLNSLQDTLQHLALHYKPMQDSSVLLGHLVIFKSSSCFEIDGSLYYHHSLDDCNPMLGTAFI